MKRRLRYGPAYQTYLSTWLFLEIESLTISLR